MRYLYYLFLSFSLLSIASGQDYHSLGNLIELRIYARDSSEINQSEKIFISVKNLSHDTLYISNPNKTNNTVPLILRNSEFYTCNFSPRPDPCDILDLVVLLPYADLKYEYIQPVNAILDGCNSVEDLEIYFEYGGVVTDSEYYLLPKKYFKGRNINKLNISKLLRIISKIEPEIISIKSNILKIVQN